MIMQYVDMSMKEDNLKKDKVYYQNGMRIRTRETLYTMIEKWNSKKHQLKTTNEFITHTALKQAEMQNSDDAYPVGYMLGTTEQGIYTTTNNQIQELLGATFEVSYQIINQKGVSSKIWEMTKEKATEQFPNPYGKEHKRLKF